jgi:hypothetical protein
MESKFQKIVENAIWYNQFLYGLVLALFFGGTTLLSGFNPVWALVQVLAIAALREYYMEYAFLKWSWRNFFFIQVPAFLIYIFITL